MDSLPARLALWLRAQLLRPRLDREMQEEMAEHLERATARLVARGLSPNDARHQATREFGNVTAHQEAGREARGWRWLYALAGDLRFALRLFAKRPAVTLTVVFVLATGMSIVTALYSFVHSYAYEPPRGVPQADDLVRIRGTLRHEGIVVGRTFTPDEVRAQAALTGHFRQVGAWFDRPVFLGAGGDADRRAEPAIATFVNEHYFSVLGIRPLLGAGLTLADFAANAPTTAVISHAAWQKLFGARSDIVGRTVVVDGTLATVVGVAPRRFSGVSLSSPIKVWMPLSALPHLGLGAWRDGANLGTVARLQPRAEIGGASAAIAVVASRAFHENPSARIHLGTPEADVIPLVAASGDPNFERDVQVMTACFTALGILVLLVTCTNVSALITGLGLARRKEIAVRLSMGAGRARIVRQLLTESTLLASVAGIATVAAIWAAQRAFDAYAPQIPITVSVSWAAVLFTFALSLAVGIAFGLSPALHATRVTLADSLKESSSMIAASGTRLQRGLVVAQIALTQPLVVGVVALLLVVAGAYDRQGFSPVAEQVVSLKVRMLRGDEARRTRADSLAVAARTQADVRRLRARLERTPGVVRVIADVGSAVRFTGYGVHRDDRVPGGSEEVFRLAAARAAPGFLDAMGVPVVAGTDLLPTDTIGVDRGAITAVVIGDALARTLWPGANPIGRRLVPIAEDLDAPGMTRPTLVVRGVADQNDDDPNVAYDGHQVTIAAQGDPFGPVALLVRTRGTAGPMMPTLRRIVAEEIPSAASIDARTMKDEEAEARTAYALVTAALGVGGGLALLIAAIGLYAVVALSVGQRTGEIAVRMAVGARADQISRRFIGDGLRLGAIGLAIGLPLSLVALRILLSVPELLPPVGLGWVGAIAAVCVLLVAVAAAVIPARRAAGVDPATVLRAD